MDSFDREVLQEVVDEEARRLWQAIILQLVGRGRADVVPMVELTNRLTDEYKGKFRPND